MSELHFSYLLASLRDAQPLDFAQQEQYWRCCAIVADLSDEEVVELLEALHQHAILYDPPRSELLDPVLAQLVARHQARRSPLPTGQRERIQALYYALGVHSPCGWRLLQWLASAAGDEDLAALVECLVSAPPAEPRAAALTLTPLFQHRDYHPADLFPRLFAALQHLSVAAPILDLANYLARCGLVPRHPASHRRSELIGLLGSLVQQLACIEENPAGTGERPEALGEKVDECVALVVSLCDALALMGASDAVGKLYQALQLHHRRIRTEAAAALVKLGDESGIDQLVALAEEPVARLRVLAHAEELGVSQRIDPQYTTEPARAEAQVALELAQPTRFGLPPSGLSLVDTRTQFWPGYDQPVTCYLFRYEYAFHEAHYSNIAIAGPLVHTFTADLNDLSPDEIYAAFAGWHVKDESVFEVPLDAPTIHQRAEVERYARRLRDEGYDAIRSLMLGYFFGERVLIARAAREGNAGIAAVDPQGIEWYPHRTRRYPLGPHEAFCIYTGRRLLRSFNG